MKRKAESNTSKPAKKDHWSTGLLKTMEDPESKVKEDDKIVVIKDKYPKAQFHYLVLPKDDISSIWHVKRNHHDLLMHMHNVARGLVNKQTDHEFIIGYHAMPSMQRLHLHVSSDVCRQLREGGEIKKITPDRCKAYLNTELKCHKCSVYPKNMPDLKRHLLTHITKK